MAVVRVPLVSAPRLGAVGALVAVLLLAGCADGELQAMCESRDAWMPEDVARNLDPEDGTDVVAVLSDASETVRDIEAPREVADDWALLREMYGTIAENLDGIDPADRAAVDTAITDAGATFNYRAGELQAAQENLTAFVAENCAG